MQKAQTDLRFEFKLSARLVANADVENFKVCRRPDVALTYANIYS
jgi:hypothetical protein